MGNERKEHRQSSRRARREARREAIRGAADQAKHHSCLMVMIAPTIVATTTR